jgi:hypothetical protein
MILSGGVEVSDDGGALGVSFRNAKDSPRVQSLRQSAISKASRSSQSRRAASDIHVCACPGIFRMAGPLDRPAHAAFNPPSIGCNERPM